MLDQVGRDLPDIWAQHADWMAQARAEAPWPNWCYAPLAAAAPIFDRPLLAAKVTALAAWRMTQGIYRVDPTLRDALVSTPLDGAIPFEVLLRMPEWCVYVELPPLQTLRGIAHGVWAWVEPGREEGAAVLCLLFDTERELASSMRDDSMFMACVQLRGASLAAALEATFPDGEEVHGWFRSAAEPVSCRSCSTSVRGMPGSRAAASRIDPACRCRSGLAAQACACTLPRSPSTGISVSAWARRCAPRWTRRRTMQDPSARASRLTCGAPIGTPFCRGRSRISRAAIADGMCAGCRPSR